jgi:hypothetical protein
MQEVRGSNPLSSTGQKQNSNSSNGEYSSKYSNAARAYLRPGQPGSGSASRLGCWHSRLKPELGTDFGAHDQEERPIRPSVDTCPPLVYGARFLVTLAACATRQASHARPGRCSVSSHDCRRTAPWPSMMRRLAPGAASSVPRRGCGAPRRNLAHSEARHRAARRGPSA